MADHFVYENWRHKRARVHKAECSQCNHGRGKRATNESNSGRWLGPFDGRDEAFRAMQRLDQADEGGCAFCNP